MLQFVLDTEHRREYPRPDYLLIQHGHRNESKFSKIGRYNLFNQSERRTNIQQRLQDIKHFPPENQNKERA